jgi:antitoxin PrlF
VRKERAMLKSTLTSKGQVTIPKQVRDKLGLKMGDRLMFRIEGDGKFVVERAEEDPLEGLVGMLRHLAQDRPFTDEEMNEAIARHHAAEDDRIKGYYK